MREYNVQNNPSTTDQCMIWDVNNSDFRLSPISSLLALVNLDGYIKEPLTQHAAPLSGFTVTVTGENVDVHLILSPVSTLATGTITLPLSPGTRDKQSVVVTSVERVTALTVSGNGASVVGAPTAIGAGGFFKMKYDMATNAWYRVG